MSKKQWMVLLMLFLTYLFLGASIFYHIESRLEMEHVELAKQERIEINALLHKHYVPSASHDFEEILGKLTQYCGKSVRNVTGNETDNLRWDFYNSFYFAYTVVSTIGYGNLSPTNMLSRILMMFYGLIGIPMNGILLTQLGEFFGTVFVKAHQKYKSYKRSREHYTPKKLSSFETHKVGLAAQIFAYLTPGFIMFIFFPAFLFSHYEGWTYDEAVYYAFVTLTTIGFGDIVAGQDNTKGSGVFFIMYKIFLICWISFGLGYIVMIFTFITQGMRSKKITRLEHKLALNLKHTQSKIWNELNKEINYLRRVFNELQLSKVKRVYVDEYEYEGPPTKLPRSNSFPDLRDLTFGGHPECIAFRPRRRANSEVVPVDDHIARVVSETDLQRIDKNATFAAHAMVQPAELLARLVNILGYIPPSDEADQVEQDLRNEKLKEEQGTDWWSDSHKDYNQQRSISTGSPWRMGNENIPPFGKLRSRAASEVRLYDTKNDVNAQQRHVDWTWSGPAASKKIQELMNAQTMASTDSTPKAPTHKISVLRSLGLSMPKTLIPRWRRQCSNKKTTDLETGVTGTGLEKVDVEKRDNSSSQNGTITHSGIPLAARFDDRRDSLSAMHYYTHTGANRSNFAEGSNLLEETSLADFLRALTVLHASVGTVPEKSLGKPRRKMGTASLTPPKLPSLFTLFSSPPPGATDTVTQSNQSTITGAQAKEISRRLSLNVSEKHGSGTSTPSHGRRGSLAFIKPRRRFSLRPVATPISPPTPPNSDAPTISNFRDAFDERTLRQTSIQNSYVLESSREPLIEMETAPGISSPVKPISTSRRSSLRPTPTGTQPVTGSSGIAGLAGKPLPRWKAGMLQRQISQMHLRRRVRAFSLSDVGANEHDREQDPVLDPLNVDGTSSRLRKIRPDALPDIGARIGTETVRKSVTLLTPTKGQVYWPAQDDDPPSLSSTSIDTSPAENAPATQTLRNTNISDTRFNDQTVQTNVVLLKNAESAKKDTSEVAGKSGEISREKEDTTMPENLYANENDLKPCERPSARTSGEKKARVSIEHYEPLSEVKIEKPIENPFERYKAATSRSQGQDNDSAESSIDRADAKSRIHKKA